MKPAVIFSMTPCNQEDNLQHIRGTHCLHLYLPSNLKKHAASSSATFITIKLHGVILPKIATLILTVTKT